MYNKALIYYQIDLGLLSRCIIFRMVKMKAQKKRQKLLTWMKQRRAERNRAYVEEEGEKRSKEHRPFLSRVRFQDFFLCQF